MAKAKTKKRRKSNGFTLPISVTAGMVAGLSEPAKRLIDGDYHNAAKAMSLRFVGYDPDSSSWHLSYLKKGLFPVLGGVVVHKVASKIGINRAIARAGIPFLRI